MSESSISTNWEFYDPARHAESGGNYLFLLKSFGNAPYYSGEAQNFASRFAQHKRLFETGGRTFMRRSFFEESADRSHSGFASYWHRYKQQGGERRLVWVPEGSGTDVVAGPEGASFWANEVALLVSIQAEARHVIERQSQIDIMDYYDGLLGLKVDWCLPPRSRLVGHGPGSVTGPTLLHQLDGGPAGSAGTFFGSLETAGPA